MEHIPAQRNGHRQLCTLHRGFKTPLPSLGCSFLKAHNLPCVREGPLPPPSIQLTAEPKRLTHSRGLEWGERDLEVGRKGFRDGEGLSVGYSMTL